MGGYFNRNISKIMRLPTERLPGLASLALFMLLCACVAYWVMELVKPPLRTVAPPQADAPKIDISQAASLFGGHGTVTASNYKLTGVVVAQNAEESVAVLSADGKPAQAVRIGKEVQPGTSIKEVHKTYVLLSEGGILKRLILLEHAATKPEMAPVASLATPATPPATPAAPPATAPATPAATPATAPATQPATQPAAPATRPGRRHGAANP